MRSSIVIGCILTVVLIVLTAGMAITESGAPVYRAEGAFEVDWIVAYERVQSEILNGSLEGTWLYVYPIPTSGESSIETWYGSIALPDEVGWVFFIDDMPAENWAHQCRYVFIDDIGRISVHDAHGPPDNFEGWTKLSACQNTLIAERGVTNTNAGCVIAGDVIISWHKEGGTDPEVAELYVISAFNRSTHALIVNDLKYRSDFEEKEIASDSRISGVRIVNETTQTQNTAGEGSLQEESRKIPGFGIVLSIAGFFGAMVISRGGCVQEMCIPRHRKSPINAFRKHSKGNK